MTPKAPSRPKRAAVPVAQAILLIAALFAAGAALAADPPGDWTSSPSPSSEASSSPSPSPEPTVSFIVTFVSGTSASAQTASIAAVGATDVDVIAPLRMHAITLPQSGATDGVAALRADPAVALVEGDAVRAAEATPNDAAYGSQWSLPQIGWDQAYGTVTPTGTAKVAILDTGVDASHPDLAGQVVSGTSILDGSNGLADPNGHGTWMAGIIAAATDNGEGIAGVAYAGVQVMPVTVLGADGTGLDSDIIEGVVYAADHGADVILMAFSNPGYSASLQAAIDYAWSKGAVLVAAVGNDGSSSPTYPAGDRGVIGVSATDQSDALWASSNYGADTFIAAPGVSIDSTAPGGGYTSVTGTSAAAAEVAAAAALAKAVDPSASNGVIVGRLGESADAVGTADQTGNGRLNLARAVSSTSPTSVVPTGAPGGGPFVGPYVASGNATVTGSVKSSVAGNPGISDATVACTAGCSGTTTTTTDGSGNYSFSGGNKLNFSGSSASVTLSASKAGFTSQSRTFTASGTHVIDFVLTPTNSAPTATSQSVSTSEDNIKVIALAGSDADGNALTFSIVSGPSTGSLGSIGAVTCTGTAPKNCTADVTYTPAANYNGSDSFTYKVNDSTVDSTAATVTINVTPVNDAPAGTDKTVTTLEDTAYTFAAADFGFTDPNDSPANAFDSVKITTLATDGTLKLSGVAVGAGDFITVADLSAGNLKFHPDANENGTPYATFTFQVKDNGGTANGGVDLDPSANTMTINVTPVNDAPALTVTPTNVTGQYSDPLDTDSGVTGAQPVNISATDIDNPGSNLTFSIKNTSGCSAASSLPSDLALAVAAGTGDGTIADPGTRTATIDGIFNVAPATYTRCIEVSDGSATDSEMLTIAVGKEDADATYTGDMLAFTTPGGSSASVQLRATIRDSSLYSSDAYPGVITNATVTFKEGLTTLCGSVSVGLINSSTTIGSAQCQYSFTVGAHSIDIYVNGYYTGTGSGVVEVAQPDGSFITGGGYVVVSNSSSYGQYAADAGSRMNWGFNVKYNKNKTNLQGHANIIFRRTVGGLLRVYQIKSNAIDSLGVKWSPTSCAPGPASSSCVGTAEFRSKANLTDVTNPSAPIALGGNLTLHLTMTDKGEPGSTDSIGVTLWDGSTLLYSSEWDGTKTLEKQLNGGNLVVH